MKCRDGCPWLWSQSFLLQLPLPGDTEPQDSLARGGDKGGVRGAYSVLSASWINWSRPIWSTAGAELFRARHGAALGPGHLRLQPHLGGI